MFPEVAFASDLLVRRGPLKRQEWLFVVLDWPVAGLEVASFVLGTLVREKKVEVRPGGSLPGDPHV
jgi:hypothetical protein